MFLMYPEMGNAGHVLYVLELSRTDVVSKRNIGGNMPEHNDFRAEEKWRKVTRKERAQSMPYPESAHHLLFVRSGGWTRDVSGSQEKARGGWGGGGASASLRGGRGFLEQEGERRAFPVDEAPLPTVPVHQGGSCVHQGGSCSLLFPHWEEPARKAADETPVTKGRCSCDRG